MSSTSEQIDQAKKLAARVESGEQVTPIQTVNTGGASAEQLSNQTPAQPGIEISEDALMGGLNRENMPVVDTREATPVIDRRQIAKVVGKDQEQLLAKQFLSPTERAESQTALPDAQVSSAEKQTQIPGKQLEAAERISKGQQTADADLSSAAKQTKVPEAQADSAVAKAEKGQDSAPEEHKAQAVSENDAKPKAAKKEDKPKADKPKAKTTTVVEEKKTEKK